MSYVAYHVKRVKMSFGLRSRGKEMSEFLRQAEMNELIKAQTDPITQELMGMMNHILVVRLLRGEEGPTGDFDLRYFMEIIQDFASEHNTIKKILEGKGHEIVWMEEESGQGS